MFMILPPARASFLLLQSAFVEIINERRAVVFLDDVHDTAVKVVLQREVYALPSRAR
jgi:hypothetical protein